MKRFALPLAVVLVLAIAGLYLQRRVAPQARRVAAWLPGSTILFEDMPDLQRTAERWPATALAQILDEREVRAFLERPLAQMPRRAELDQRLEQARRIDPAHFFLAVTDWSGTGAPKTIAGLSYSGSKPDLDALVNELRKSVQETWPEGKSDIEKYGSGEIETFTTPAFSAALAYRGRWLLIATDTGLLKAALDRFDGAAGPDSLAELPEFKSCLQHLPGAPDNLIFLRPGLLADKAASFAMMLSPTADTQGMDSMKKIEAVGLALKLDGEVMRDVAYVMEAQPGKPGAPLAKDALKLSTTDTIVAVNDRVQGLGSAQLPDPRSDPSGVLQLLDSYIKVFTDQGLGADELAEAFGPESGFLLDWPAGAIPMPLVMVDVRDSGKARKFLDTLATLPLAAGVSFTRREAGGTVLYSLPPTGFGLFPLQVTLGLSGKCVIGALNVDAVTEAAKRWDAGGAGLGGTVAYKKAVGLVEEPTSSFTYVDTKKIFERVYGLFSGVASMGLVPHLSDYVDIGKLPKLETISRHLSPIVASTAETDGGLLMESAGPVTASQAVLVTALTLGAASAPLLEEQMKGQSVTIPGFPGFNSGPPSPGQNPFAIPSNPVTSGTPAPAASPVPGAAAPSASPSGGTP